MFSNAKLQQYLWTKVVVLSSNLITIGYERLEDFGRGMNKSSSDSSNMKLFSCDACVLINILCKT
jgi:hypothetical protein